MATKRRKSRKSKRRKSRRYKGGREDQVREVEEVLRLPIRERVADKNGKIATVQKLRVFTPEELNRMNTKHDNILPLIYSDLLLYTNSAETPSNITQEDYIKLIKYRNRVAEKLGFDPKPVPEAAVVSDSNPEPESNPGLRSKMPTISNVKKFFTRP